MNRRITDAPRIPRQLLLARVTVLLVIPVVFWVLLIWWLTK